MRWNRIVPMALAAGVLIGAAAVTSTTDDRGPDTVGPITLSDVTWQARAFAMSPLVTFDEQRSTGRWYATVLLRNIRDDDRRTPESLALDVTFEDGTELRCENRSRTSTSTYSTSQVRLWCERWNPDAQVTDVRLQAS